jgi:hypothetical protein
MFPLGKVMERQALSPTPTVFMSPGSEKLPLQLLTLTKLGAAGTMKKPRCLGDPIA